MEDALTKLPKFAVLQLSGCAGCEVSLLNASEWYDKYELVYMPLVVSTHRIPDDIEVLLISGGVRNDEDAAASLGFNSDQYKVFAFGIGTFFAGMTGSVYAHFMGFISSTDFAFPVSIGVLSMAVLGGLGTVSGPLIGAIILTLAPEVFRFVSDYRMLVYGGLLVLMMRFQPQGLVGDDSFLQRTWTNLRGRGKGDERHG